MATIRTPAELDQKKEAVQAFINMAAAYGSTAHSYVLGVLDALRWMKKVPPVASLDLCALAENQPANKPLELP